MRAAWITSVSCGLFFSLGDAVTAQQSDWRLFRGNTSDGVARGARDLPTEFGPENNVVWRADIAPGHASPIVVGDRVFVCGHRGREFEVVCFDVASGEQKWHRAVRAAALEKVHRVNSNASATPASDGKRIYVRFGSFGLICFDLEGNECWRRAIDSPDNIFGSASSPIVHGSTLIIHTDQKKGSWLEAIDGESGETKWRREREGFVSGWSTPVVWKNGDVDEVLVYGSFRLVAYRLEDGDERWSVPGLADEPCITPVVANGVVYVTSYNMRTSTEAIGLPDFGVLLEKLDENSDKRLDREEAAKNKSVLSRSDADGEGDHPLRIFFRWLDEDRDGFLVREEYGKLEKWLATFKHANALVAIRPGDGQGRPAKILWQYPRGVPECPSPLVHEGRVYLVKNGGLATCVDAKTGELVWQGRTRGRGPHYASPIYGDGKIYSCSARGQVSVFKAGPTLEVLAHNDLGQRIMATPAIVSNRLLIRTKNSLWCFGKR